MPIDEQSSLFHDAKFVQKVKESGLDLNTLRIHHERFLLFKNNGMKNRNFPIQDSCRINNGRMLPYSSLKTFPLLVKNVASFLPAAGSSTRYLQPIYEHSLGSQTISEWILPRHKKTGDLLPLTDMLKLPKALYPCVVEGNTFLELKFLEQNPISGIEKTVCIIPPNTLEHFKSEIDKIGILKENVLFLDQGPELSTLRMEKSGEPLQENGSLSIAPAGHGSLLKLFPLIKKKYPNLDCLFIRNLDNVIGCKEGNLQITKQFLGAHNYTLEIIKHIRISLASNQLSEAAKHAENLLEKFAARKLSRGKEEFLNTKNEPERTLWTLQFSVFQTPIELAKYTKLAELFDRPLNFLGQVPNLGKDRGGTPVIIQTPEGDTAVCVETPHFSDEDQKRLSDTEFATHFNPVFAAVEVQEDIENYEHEKNSFWIFAEKQWKGKTVYYHESLLYEMLGNSKFVNLVFVELPRSIFNPHKTLDDTRGQTLKEWI